MQRKKISKMFVYSLLISSLLHISTSAPPKGGTFKWIAKSWPKKIPIPNVPIFKSTNLQARFTISCETNDPNATVTLNYQTNKRAKFQNILTVGRGRIIQTDQSFVVTSVKSADAGIYTCSAVDKKGTKLKNLYKGQLLVSSVIRDVKPEIIPEKGVKIETRGSFTIRCKTKTSGKTTKSILTWYRKLPNGGKEKVDASMVTGKKDERPDKTVIDVKALKFINFTSADAGEYICVRTYQGTTERSVRVELEPDTAPKVSIIPSTTKPKENDPLRLTCSASGSPKPRISWKINGKVIKIEGKDSCHPSGDIREDSKCILYIPKVKLKDHNGDFTCTAQNQMVTSNGEDSKTVEIEVQVKPLLRNHYKTDSIVKRSKEDVELFCEVLKTDKVLRANPLPTFTWYEQICSAGDNCKMNESSWKPVVKQYPDDSTETKRSYIVAPKVGVPYWYRCIAKNPSGNDSSEFQVIRQAHEMYQFGIQSDKAEDGVLEVYEKEEIVIKCFVDSTIYKSRNLKKGGVNLVTGETTEGSTIVLKYTKENANVKNDTGIYTCGAISKSDVPRTRTIEVKVKKLIAPSISKFNDKKIVQGKNPNYVISCDASGSPPPKVSWKFKGNVKSLTIGSIDTCKQSTAGIYVIKKTNQLAICDVDFIDHQGIYECVATNRVSTKSATMNLTIEAKPNITGWKNTIQVGSSKPATLRCITKANPPANVTWYREEKKGKGKGKGKTVNVFLKTNMGSSYLRIPKVSEDMHSGAYVCRAKNALGSVSKRMGLVVLAGSVIQKAADTSMVIGVVVAAVILLILAVILMCWYKHRLKEKYAMYLAPDETFELDPDKTIFEQSNDLPYDMVWEFPRNRLVFIKTLGSGAFGEVWLAEASGIHAFKPRDTSAAAAKRRKSMQKSKRYHSVTIRYKKQQDLGEIDLEKTQVAVKKLKKDASQDDYKDLASELKIIIHLGEHKHIVNLLGACTIGGDLNVILECCPHGNLLSFLRARRDIFQPEWYKKDTDMEKELTYIDLVMICHQAAKGMEFLQSSKCVHRDLAARNVLVGTDFIMKIGDFGLARDLANDDLYLKQTTGLLPVKWMAPESLFDKVYTSMSDVWSFGILLWEVFTLGGSPYPGLPTEDLFSFLEDGKRMDRPDACPVEMYEIMMDCWVRSPYGRPMFGQVEERIGNCMKQNIHNDSEYLDYRDAPPQQPPDNYLMANDDSRNAAPNDYLMANDMSNGMCNDPLYVPPEDQFSKFSPKGQTYVPPTSGSISGDDDDEHQYDPCDLPLIPKGRRDSYDKMTPDEDYLQPADDDYLNPSDTDYLNPIDLHPTIV